MQRIRIQSRRDDFRTAHSDSKLPDGFLLAERDIVFTYQGRYAIFLICQLLHIGAGDEVIVPAYNCGAEVDPFVWAGAKVIFYRIDDRAAIDTEDIIRRVTPNTDHLCDTFFRMASGNQRPCQMVQEKGIVLAGRLRLTLFSRGPDNTLVESGMPRFTVLSNPFRCRMAVLWC